MCVTGDDGPAKFPCVSQRSPVLYTKEYNPQVQAFQASFCLRQITTPRDGRQTSDDPPTSINHQSTELISKYRSHRRKPSYYFAERSKEPKPLPIPHRPSNPKQSYYQFATMTTSYQSQRQQYFRVSAAAGKLPFVVARF
jgi:hypothetical protein